MSLDDVTGMRSEFGAPQLASIIGSAISSVLMRGERRLSGAGLSVWGVAIGVLFACASPVLYAAPVALLGVCLW